MARSWLGTDLLRAVGEQEEIDSFRRGKLDWFIWRVAQTTLEKKLESIVRGSDKREDIIIQQSSDSLDQIQFATDLSPS